MPPSWFVCNYCDTIFESSLSVYIPVLMASIGSDDFHKRLHRCLESIHFDVDVKVL